MIKRRLSDITFQQAVAAMSGLPDAHIFQGGKNAAETWGGKWDFIVALPSKKFQMHQGAVLIDGRVSEAKPEDAFDLVRREHMARRLDAKLGVAPLFISGAVGAVSYEMAQYIEPSLRLPKSDEAQLDFGFYDATAAWHRETGEAYIFGRSEKAIDRLESALLKEVVDSINPRFSSVEITDDCSKDTYCNRVQYCIDQILEGEIFQANLTQMKSANLSSVRAIDFGALYLSWMAGSASSFGCLMQYEGYSYISNSPERYFSVRRGQDGFLITAEPIKGTRSRSDDAEEDRVNADALLNDEKDRAENIMIADLVRNDLSRVCEDASIKEEAICELRSFANVHHLVSTISGKLLPDKTAFDALYNSFPCGSITGAPKIRAMEIIAETEARPRGIYCGAIGFVDDRGDAEFSVAIRTMEAQRNEDHIQLRYGAGGGITCLSNPLTEYYEAQSKAKAFEQFISLLSEGELVE